MSIVDKYTKELRREEPIKYNGLTLHPLTVEQYTLYYTAKPAFELMQASLSPVLARLSWCNCLDELDRIAQKEGKTVSFLLPVMMVLATACHLDPIQGGEEKGNLPIRLARDPSTTQLAAVVIGDGDNPAVINMMQMSELREIIAAQNCYDIQKETWNPDLVRAQQYHAAQQDNGIEFDVDKLIYSVAYNAHVNPAEIWDWSIKRFQGVQAAIDRTFNFTIYTQAQASGFVTFKKGNPFPSWRFDRKADLPSAFTDISEYDEGSKGLLGKPSTNYVKEN